MSLLSDWDVLVFLHRHPVSLMSADGIGRLLGYSGVVIADTLTRFERLGLVHRSHPSAGIRLHRFAWPDDPFLRQCVQHLVEEADTRTARAHLATLLRRGNRSTLTRMSTLPRPPLASANVHD